MILIAVALAPVIVILTYINKRDKYEKEPLKLLIKVFVFGIISVIPVFFIETALTNYWHTKYALPNMPLQTAAYEGFITAALTEELFKLFVFFIFIWKNRNFNEKFDGIVYAVFISMGFAATENLMYVLSTGFGTGIIRAFTAVPAHAIFAVSSGYFLAFAKFKPKGKILYLILALAVPILLHGIYDFILLSKNDLLLLIFVPYVIFILIVAFKEIKRHSDASRFNPKNS